MPKAKIYLNGQIGEDWWSGVDNTASRFIADFNAALADDSVDEIDIHINSVGGDVHEGLGIYNTIKASQKPTVAVIDGVAYSMGAIIALAANKTHIAANGMFMLHNASGMDWGNAKQFRTTADLLDRYDNQLAVGVAAKTGLSIEEVKDMWFNYEDNFFTAQEAKDASLVDVVLDDAADLPTDFDAQGPRLKVAAQLSKHFAPQQRSWFNRLVTRVKDELVVEKIENNLPPTPENKEEPMIIKNTHKALLAFFCVEPVEDDAVNNVLPTNEQVEQLNERLEAITAAENNATNLQATIDQLTAERAQLQSEVERLGQLAGQAPTPPAGGDDPENNLDPKPKYSWDEEREALLARRKQNKE